jgi:hypothetical protein
MPPLASNGKPGYIRGPAGSGIEVYLDVITKIDRSHRRERTTNSLERGRPLTVHRIRTPEQLVLDVFASDIEAAPGATISGRWEQDHARKTLERLLAAQAYDGGELTVWNGDAFERNAVGQSRVWVLDEISHSLEGASTKQLRATLTFGEQPRFSDSFTTALQDTDPSLADVTGGVADRGRQSNEAVDAETGASIIAGAWP